MKKVLRIVGRKFWRKYKIKGHKKIINKIIIIYY